MGKIKKGTLVEIVEADDKNYIGLRLYVVDWNKNDLYTLSFDKDWKSGMYCHSGMEAARRDLGWPKESLKIISTGYFDDNGEPIFVGDKLKSIYGYEVIVAKYDDKDDFYGQLVCDSTHPCKTIGYSLNEGKQHTKVK